MNVAKVALTLIFLLLMIIIFFALTGLDVNHPMAAVERIIAWSARLNRTRYTQPPHTAGWTQKARPSP